ncbi:MAG: flavodoxin-dependent (E)-4-hydroxy-3-methylbut-2-enyl-diphosphate synthase [Candidatus Omnitrophota bacterium]|nr:flavodoxin-dependent (E)-4-hydroxy-3-methylbut-2-enyl-diphosphate synthase [Candidatus Omnitrophota bacterium]
MKIRRKTRIIKIGNIKIGANNPIAIQSMAKAKTSCIEKTVKQLKELEDAGCEIARLAIKDSSDARSIKRIKTLINLPIVADIHFNWRLAIEAIDNGADKIRLNPGNIYNKKQIKEVATAAKINCVPIRVGVNSGSLLVRRLAGSMARRPEAGKMVKSAMDYIKVLEDFRFYNIVVSLKGSNIYDTIKAYQEIIKFCDYPLHLGVTATGFSYSGAIKSAIALGVLLKEGIGDTIRVSLTDTPAQEVKAAKAILESLGLRCFGPEIISCPTCGRCEVDLIKIVKELENRLIGFPVSQLAGLTGTPAHRHTGIPKVALMGCEVNGPGEAKQADIGIAFGRKDGLLFSKGKPIKKVSINKCMDVLLKEINKI